MTYTLHPIEGYIIIEGKKHHLDPDVIQIIGGLINNVQHFENKSVNLANEVAVLQLLKIRGREN